MTDTNQGAGAPASESTSKTIPIEPAIVDAVPKAKVNEIAQDAHERGYEKGRQEALAELQLQMQAQQPYQPPQNAQVNQPNQAVVAPQQPPMPQVAPPAVGQFAAPTGQMPSTVDIQKMIDERVSQQTQALQQQQMQQQQQMHWANTVNQFVSKIQTGAGKYADFDKVVSPLELDKPQNQHLVHLTNLVDNTVDVLHDLGNNPEKLSLIEGLWRSHPQLAIKKINDLSNSIKTNQMASTVAIPNDPLSQITPSTVTTADNGLPLTASDWRKRYVGKR